MKAKKRIERKAPKSLSFVRPFEYDVPLSIDACSEYVDKLNKRWLDSYSVFLSSIEQGQVFFTIRKSEGKAVKVWAVGSLQVTSDESCRIVGKAGIATIDLGIGVFVILGVSLLFFPLDASDIFYYLCFLPLVFIIIRFAIISTRNTLIRTLDLRQHAPEKPKRLSEL